MLRHNILQAMAESNNVLRPTPRRPFDLTPVSTDSSAPPTPSPENANAELLENKLNGLPTSSRSRSFLNLTSSTLFGIYSPTGYEVSREEPTTPWGTGAQTPSFRTSDDGNRPQDIANWQAANSQQIAHHARIPWPEYIGLLLIRAAVLFGFGLAYGAVITRLHENDKVAPVKVKAINRDSWQYLAFWGISGVVLGNFLPWIDNNAPDTTVVSSRPLSNGRPKHAVPMDKGASGPTSNNLGADWNPVVRSIGAFVGIAFAIVSAPDTLPSSVSYDPEC